MATLINSEINTKSHTRKLDLDPSERPVVNVMNFFHWYSWH